MTIQNVINRLKTTPFLFVGSGLTRRYMDLPNWKTLLEHFAYLINEDEFSYSSYENRARTMSCPAGVMPKVAELIHQDYNKKWFADPKVRTLDHEMLERVKDGLSPFKAEIAAHIQRNSVVKSDYETEIQALAEISEKSISGVITTNYDTFLEDHFMGFKKYVGQNQLILSAIQGVAEIYKIHGSIEDPASIVIDESDYVQFEAKSAYLAAKLMTIFMEYPIIFLGYSLSDTNVQNIIRSIVNCLDDEQLQLMKQQFIFVEYKRDAIKEEVASHSIAIDGKTFPMTKITLSDFMPLYKALGEKQAKLPVRILRHLKQELYSFVITNTPTANLRVASLDDSRVGDEELVLAIGRADQVGMKGLSGITASEWYRDIVMDDLVFAADDLLEHAFSVLNRGNSGLMPVNKYLSQATKEFPECVEHAKRFTFDNLINDTIKKYRSRIAPFTSVKQIWEKHKLAKAVELIAYLTEEQMDVNELGAVLREIFTENPDILDNGESAVRTNVRRLIRIYDYLMWGK